MILPSGGSRKCFNQFDEFVFYSQIDFDNRKRLFNIYLNGRPKRIWLIDHHDAALSAHCSLRRKMNCMQSSAKVRRICTSIYPQRARIETQQKRTMDWKSSQSDFNFTRIERPIKANVLTIRVQNVCSKPRRPTRKSVQQTKPNTASHHTFFKAPFVDAFAYWP